MAESGGIAVSWYQPPVYDLKVTTKEPVATTYQSNASSNSSTQQGSNSSSSQTNTASYQTASRQSSRISVTTTHLVTDDGAGYLFGPLGTVSYLGKAIQVKVQADSSESAFESNHEDASSWENLNATGENSATSASSSSSGPGGGSGSSSSQSQSYSASTGGGGSATARGGTTSALAVTDAFGSNSLLVRYKTGTASPQSHSESFTPPFASFDLTPYTRDVIVPGSVQFTWMGQTFTDFEGRIYRGRTDTNPGVHAGGISYTTGVCTLFDYTVGPNPQSITIQSLWTRKPREHIANVSFAVALSPLKPSGLILSVLDIEGNQIIATSTIDGMITGTHTRGVIDYNSGLVEVQFGDYVLDASLTAAQKAEWWYDPGNIRTADSKIWRPWPVSPDTLRYNAVSYAYLPLDADILGLDPVRLPQDGRVPIFRPGGFAVIGHTGTVGPATVSNGQTIDCARVRLSRIRVIGHDGHVINDGYTQNLDAGTVTFTDVTGYSQPVTVEHRIEDMAMVSDVQINGWVTFTRQLTHDYPLGAHLASAMVAGDLKARVSLTFDQVSWTGVWSDSVIGNSATGTFNDISNPIEVTNKGAVTERWAVTFTNTTSFTVAGEHVGVIATGNVSANCAPLNPATGQPYFTIPATGWGLGWAAGNVLRFNTIGALAPAWLVRTVQQGPETVINDSFTLLVRGDVDRP